MEIIKYINNLDEIRILLFIKEEENNITYHMNLILMIDD